MDDFTTTGPKRELDRFEDKFEAKYELKKGGRLGPALDDVKDLTVLHRVIRWAGDGVEYEADPRQCERHLKGLGFDDGCTSTATLGRKAFIQQLKEDKPFDAEDHTEFRALAFRANYLAQDRIDIQLPAKDV